jgi:hypothetical protein
VTELARHLSENTLYILQVRLLTESHRSRACCSTRRSGYAAASRQDQMHYSALLLLALPAALAAAPLPFGVQVLTSLEKVYPKAGDDEPTVTGESGWRRIRAQGASAAAASISLSLARGEYEAAQLVVTAAADIPRFTARPGRLCISTSSPTRCLAADAVEIHPIGWVNLLAARVDGDRLGWIPDPLLQNVPLALARGQRVAFLVRVRSDQAHPGGYTGAVTLSWGGAAPGTMEVPLAVTVWDFELPQQGHLSTCLMMTWSDPKNMWPEKPWDDRERLMESLLSVAEVAAANRMYPCTIASGLLSWDWHGQGATHLGWPTHDCNSDNTGCVFNTTRTGFLLDWLVDHGTPAVLIGLTGNMFLTNRTTMERKSALAEYLRDYVPFLAKRGQLPDAYLYGVDEPWGAAVEQAKQTAEFVKAQQPELKFLQNTNQNNSAIIGELAGHFDALDINLQWFDATNASGYAAAGAIPELWWNLNIWSA